MHTNSSPSFPPPLPPFSFSLFPPSPNFFSLLQHIWNVSTSSLLFFFFFLTLLDLLKRLVSQKQTQVFFWQMFSYRFHSVKKGERQILYFRSFGWTFSRFFYLFIITRLWPLNLLSFLVVVFWNADVRELNTVVSLFGNYEQNFRESHDQRSCDILRSEF